MICGFSYVAIYSKVTSRSKESGEVLTLEKVVQEILEYKIDNLALGAVEGAEEGVKKKRGQSKKYQRRSI